MPSPAQLTDWLKRGLDIPAASAEAIAARITPAIIVGDVSSWYQNNSLIDRPSSGWLLSAAVAGEYSQLALYNGPSTGVNLLLEQFWVGPATGGYVEIMLASAAVVDAETPSESQTLRMFRDGRTVTPSPATVADRPTGRLFYWSGVAQVDGQRGYRVYASSTTQQISFPCLIPPGQALVLANQTVNVTMYASFQWRELRIPR